MSSKSLRRKIALLLLIVTLAVPWAEAARPLSESAQHQEIFSRQPLVFLGKVWTSLVHLWNKTGCQIDPDGRCVVTPTPGPTNAVDEGCQIDPTGTDTGCQIDPSGRQ